MTVTLLASLAACGGGDERLSKREFITRGDAICARLTKQTDELDEPTKPADVVRYLEQALSLAERSRAEFARLDAPKDGDDVQKALLASLDDSLATAEDALEAADDGDFEKMASLLTDATAAGNEADADARDYGFKECGTSATDKNA